MSPEHHCPFKKHLDQQCARFCLEPIRDVERVLVSDRRPTPPCLWWCRPTSSTSCVSSTPTLRERPASCSRLLPSRVLAGGQPNFFYFIVLPNDSLENDTLIDSCSVRYANIVLKKADIPLSKRAGELTEEDTEKLITIMQVSRQLLVI